MLIPPVSINTKDESLTFPYLRSRVKPEKSATIADFEPVSILNKVDLPTLGRPTIAITEDIDFKQYRVLFFNLWKA
tara:strand:- start:3175 stop:3402 length:228 start_codon:yes stop_codon:yes gene_type:complete